MRATLALCLATVATVELILQSQARDAVVSAGTGIVSGVVRHGTERRVVPRAHVTLLALDATAARTVVTDERGRFVFAGLSPARYQLTASKPGYVRTGYGARQPGRSGSSIAVAEGQHVTDISLSLPPGAVIAGTVFDESGQPAPQRSIRAFRFQSVGGTKGLVPVPASSAVFDHANQPATDDRGEYRLYGLPPGEYLLAASSRAASLASVIAFRQMTEQDVTRALALLSAPPGGDPAQERSLLTGRGVVTVPTDPISYVTFYHPGTAVASQATRVVVAVGEERHGIDIRASLIRASRLEGVVASNDGRGTGNTLVQVLSEDPQPELMRPSALTVGPEGRFAAPGLAPGRYRLEARTVDVGGTPASAPRGRWAAASVSVGVGAATSVTLALERTAELSGRISYEGERSAPDDIPVEVTLQPAELLPGSWLARRTAASGRGAFVLRDVPPGWYRLRAAPRNAPLWGLARVAIAGKEVIDEAFEVVAGTDIRDVVLTFSTSMAQVSGELQDSGGSRTSEYSIVLFPADRALWTSERRVRSMRLATDGTFLFRQVPDGAYRLAVVTDLAPGEEHDSAVLEQLLGASWSFDVARGGKIHQVLRVAPAAGASQSPREPQ